MSERFKDPPEQEMVAHDVNALTERLRDLEIRFHVSRRFVLEIEKCLHHGQILAALSVGLTCIEILLRESLVKHRFGSRRNSHQPSVHAQFYEQLRNAEEDKHLSVPKMIEELKSNRVLSEHEATGIKNVYERLRIPLHHGIVGRYVRERSCPVLRPVVEAEGFALFSDPGDFESLIENQGLEELGEVIDQISAIVSKGAV